MESAVYQYGSGFMALGQVAQQFLLSGTLDIRKLRKYIIVLLIDFIVRRLDDRLNKLNCRTPMRMLEYYWYKGSSKVSYKYSSSSVFQEMLNFHKIMSILYHVSTNSNNLSAKNVMSYEGAVDWDKIESFDIKLGDLHIEFRIDGQNKASQTQGFYSQGSRRRTIQTVDIDGRVIEGSNETLNISVVSWKRSESELKEYINTTLTEAYESHLRRDNKRWIIALADRYHAQYPTSFIMDNCVEFNSNKTLDDVFLDDKDKLINAIERLESKQLDKLNIFLHGEPGTGKTSIVKALANRTKRHVVKVNTRTGLQHLKRFTKPTVVVSEKFSGLVNPSDIILLFEDIDADGTLFLKRTQEITKGDPYVRSRSGRYIDENGFEVAPDTFSDLINVFDGVCELHNTIMIFTTNHINKIDPAIYRAGRMTLNLNVGRISKANALEMVHLYIPSFNNYERLRDKAITPAEMEGVLRECQGESENFESLYEQAIERRKAEDLALEKEKEEQEKEKRNRQIELDQQNKFVRQRGSRFKNIVQPIPYSKPSSSDEGEDDD